MLIHVVIIEDEPIEAEGEKRRILRMQHPQIADVRVFCRAVEAAACLADFLEPAIILIDINMPELSGIDIMEALKGKANLRFIVVSAYDNFKYAQRAMEFGARRYLLKPSSYDEFRDAVMTTIAELNRSLSLSETWLQDIGKESLPQIQSDLLRINLAKYPFYCIIKCTKSLAPPLFTADSAGTGWRSCGFHRNQVLLLNINGSGGQKEFLIQLNHYHIPGPCVMSRIGTASDLADLNRETEAALIPRAAILPGEIVFLEEDGRKPARVEGEKQLLLQLELCAEQGDYSALERIIMETVTENLREASLGAIDHYLSAITAMIQKAGEKEAVEEQELDNEAYCAYQNAASLGDVADRFCGLIRRIREASVREKPHRAVAWAESYIEKHLGEKPNMAELANRLDMNYSYFSQLFKKETGKSFSEYIGELRMKEAGKLLLQNEDLTETACRIGFVNVKSFFRAFKEYYGMTPDQWRRKNGSQ